MGSCDTHASWQSFPSTLPFFHRSDWSLHDTPGALVRLSPYVHALPFCPWQHLFLPLFHLQEFGVFFFSFFKFYYLGLVVNRFINHRTPPCQMMLAFVGVFSGQTIVVAGFPVEQRQIMVFLQNIEAGPPPLHLRLPKTSQSIQTPANLCTG